MNISYIKNSSEQCMNILEDIYKALNTFNLVGYAQQSTNINCMDALKQVYGQLEEINKQVTDELMEKDSSKKEE